MSYDSPEVKAENDQESRLRSLAEGIIDNKHLREILKETHPALRRGVYDKLKPMVSFKAQPYFFLIR